MAFCGNCGQRLPEGAVFCGYCGTRQATVPVTPPPVQPEAPVYEQPAQPEAPVYTQPEAPVYTQPEVPVYEQPAQPEAPVYTQPEAPVYGQPMGDMQYNYAPQPEAPKKKSIWKILLPILGGVLLIGIVVALVLLFSKTHVESIQVEENTLTMWAGDSYRVDYEVYPLEHDDEITWQSSNESVATVKNGKIQAVGDGVCTVIVRAESGVEAQIDVTVNTKICVEAFEVDTTELTLRVGESYPMGWYVYPENYNEAVTWESWSPSIATVDENGEIFAGAEGSCTIVLKSESGVTKEIHVEVKNLTEEEMAAIGDWTSYAAYMEGEYVYFDSVYLWVYEDGTGIMTRENDSLYFTWEYDDYDYECYFYDLYFEDGTSCFMVVYYDGEYLGDLDLYLTDDFWLFFE